MSDPDASADALPPSVRAWAQAVLGSPIVAVAPVVGGASRASAIVRTAAGGEAFLRRETGTGPLADTPFTLAREYAVLRRLQGGDVPVPGVIAFSAEEDAMLMAVVPGFTSYERTLGEAEEEPLRRELMAAVVALQRMPPSLVPELGAGGPATLDETIRRDLALWRSLYEARAAARDPLLDHALDWLESAVPDGDAAPVIVHGDVGPGNFLIHDGHVAALIDWEMVRLGHPLEDVACIVARALGAPFGSANEHLATYAALSGRAVDAAALDYALVLVMVRWTIAIAIGLARPTATQNVPMLIAFRHINGRAMLAAIARRAGRPAPARVAPSAGAAREATRPALAYARAVIDGLAARAGTSPGDAHRLRGAGEMLAYLDALDRYGTDRSEAEETARVGALLGSGFASLADANAALCERIKLGALRSEPALLDHLIWRADRDQAILAGFLGSRADATIDLTA